MNWVSIRKISRIRSWCDNTGSFCQLSYYSLIYVLIHTQASDDSASSCVCVYRDSQYGRNAWFVLFACDSSPCCCQKIILKRCVHFENPFKYFTRRYDLFFYSRLWPIIIMIFYRYSGDWESPTGPPLESISLRKYSSDVCI